LPIWDRSEIPQRPEDRRPLSEDSKAREFLLKRFEHALNVRVVPDSRMLTVSYADRDPKFAAAVTNAVVDQYIKDKLYRHSVTTAEASEWMGSQLDELKKRVEVAQENLTNFQKVSGFIAVPSSTPSPGGSGQVSGSELHSPLLDRLLSLNQSLVQAQNNRITQEAIYHVAKSLDPDAVATLATTLSSAPGGASQTDLFSGLLALRAQQVTLRQQLASTAGVYGAKNPHVAEINQQIAYLGTEMKTENARILASVAGSLAMARKTEDSLQTELNQMEHQADTVNDSAVRLAVLQQEADSTRNLYEDLYTKLQESRMAEETQASDISVVSRALPGHKPSFPNWPLNIGLGIGGGLFLGAILAFIRESLDDSIKTGIEMGMLTQLPVLGSIPSFEQKAFGSVSKRNQTFPGLNETMVARTAKPQSLPGEAYRALRTTLMLSHPGAPPRTLLVASALPGEGKTTTMCNLAACFAQTGKKVLAIDADMRKPGLRKSGESDVHAGLSTVLSSDADPMTVIKPYGASVNLYLMAAGPEPPNPTELLGSARFQEVIQGLMSEFDLIVIDSPPAMLVADSALMASVVDGVVVVIRSGRSTRLTLHHFLENMRRNKANLLGFVVNDVDTDSPDFHYAFGYSGSDKYGKYYAAH
jgi:capsular exopolysaccharide synthesis family protein